MSKRTDDLNPKKSEDIKCLQDLAEEILKLKQEHRQKRPIVIEFSGSPKAGKTSCINSLELFLKRNGFSVRIIQERASVCPVSDKHSPMFNIWTSCASLSGLIGTMEDKKNNVDVLILDRGIFDSLCWFEWLVSSGRMENDIRKKTEEFFLIDDFVKNIDIVFAFQVEPKISIEREFAVLLTDKQGSIMNERVLEEYKKALLVTKKKKESFFHKVFLIDTSRLNQNEVGKKVTEDTLDTLKNLLMEHIAYFVKNEEVMRKLNLKNVIEYSEIKKIIGNIKYDLRDRVEQNNDFIQPIPIVVITNEDKNKVLVVKKQPNATDKSSPESNKILLYVGGHIRKEDNIEGKNFDFISLCKSALKREIKEELGIAIALDEKDPFIIYATDKDTSKKHMAVCFVFRMIDENTKLRLDSQELITKKGKTPSGRFLSLTQIEEEGDLESWSRLILEHVFKQKTHDNYVLEDYQK